MTGTPTNLLDFDPERLTMWFAERGEKRFRARQVQKWIHQSFVSSFREMTDLAKSLRSRLEAEAIISAPAIISDQCASDGTRKWLFDVGAGNAIEAVFIPEADRGTLCVSTQAGCAVDCAFCATGKQGFYRNLTVAEIIGQLWTANRLLRADRTEVNARPISNVVFMGMGEPLLNFDNTVAAMRLMLDDDSYGLSRRKVTLSTSGVVPMIDRLGKTCAVALAISLHAPNDTLRNTLVPINRKYPLRELMAACRRYVDVAPRDFVTFEYIMLEGVNDTPAHARELLALTLDVPSKFNLIPFNPFSLASGKPHGFVRSDRGRIRTFAETLMADGRVVTTRKTRGDDIDAACGQLAGEIRDRTRRVIRLADRTDRSRPGAIAA